MLYLLLILMPVLSIVLLPISLIRTHLADWPKSQSPPSPKSSRHPELGRDWSRVICLTRKSICDEKLQATPKQYQRTDPLFYG